MKVIGIVATENINDVCVSIVDEDTETARVRRFNFGPTSFAAVCKMLEERAWSAEFEPILSYLRESISGTDTQVIVATPSMFLDMDTGLSYAIAATTGSGACSWYYAELKEPQKIFMAVDRPIFSSKQGPRLPRPINYIYQEALESYADFLYGRPLTSECLAILLGVIARHPGTYYYLTSPGEVQSSQDVVVFLNSREQYAALGIPRDVAIEHTVVSGLDEYSMEQSDDRKDKDLRSLPRRYAVMSKKYESLGESAARKFGLLAVCKEWGIKLMCSSLRDDDTVRALLTHISSSTPPKEEDAVATALREIILHNYRHFDVAEGCEAPFLLALAKHLYEKRVFPDHLELSLFRLLPKLAPTTTAVITSANQLSVWLANAINSPPDRDSYLR